MKYFLRFLPLVLVAVVGLFAYSFTGSSDRHEQQAQSLHGPSAAADPLKVILTPIGGATKLDTQIADLQAKIKEAPERLNLLERLGWAFVAKARTSSDPGFYTLAEQTAKAMAEKTPGDPAAALLLGHTLHTQHRFAEAETVARKLTSAREFVFDYALLGDALMEQGKLGEAIEAYQKMVDLKPCLQTYSRVAHMRWLKGDLTGAIEASRLAISGGSPREPEPSAWAYTKLAQYELQAGDIERALLSVALASELVPDYAPALLMQARLLSAQGKHQEAIEPLQQAAERSPLPEYLWTLADALRAAGNEDEATKVEAQISRTGAVADSRTYAIFLASRGTEIDNALRLARQELKERQDVFTHDAIAWAELAAGRVKEAREHMHKALAEGTQDARLFYHAGVIAAADQDDAEALHFFSKARAIEQMLLPSERVALGQRTAALLENRPQVSSVN